MSACCDFEEGKASGACTWQGTMKMGKLSSLRELVSKIEILYVNKSVCIDSCSLAEKLKYKTKFRILLYPDSFWLILCTGKKLKKIGKTGER